MFIDVSDGVTKTPKLGRAVKSPYRVLGQNQQTIIIQCKEVVEVITAAKVALAPQPAGVAPISSNSASVMDVKN